MPRSASKTTNASNGTKDTNPLATPYLVRQARNLIGEFTLYVGYENGVANGAAFGRQWASGGKSLTVRPTTLQKWISGGVLIRRTRSAAPLKPNGVYAYRLSPKYR